MKSLTYSFSHEAMTTYFEVIIAHQDQEYARQAATTLFREIDRMEELLSHYNPGSDVGQINLLEAGKSTRVSFETFECLEKALWAHKASGGLFDPTVGTGIEHLTMERSTFSVGWKSTGNGQLDLGGIGKGYAIDLTAELLKDWEIENAVISGGTSTVLALGNAPGKADGWPIGIAGDWGKARGFSKIQMKNRALSGSGTEVKGAHIINPKTGKAAQEHLNAWALHPSAALSDAMSTAFMMMPEASIRQLCAETPALSAVIIKPNEQLVRIGV
jgi:FAD:protein FMN transferase